MLATVLGPLCRLRKREDVIQDATILDETCLSVVDQVRKQGAEAVADHFGEDFVSRREEGDGTPLSDLLPVFPFREENADVRLSSIFPLKKIC